MKIKFNGTGRVNIPNCGEVAHGELVEVPDDLATELIKHDPKQWSKPAVAKPPRREGRG